MNHATNLNAQSLQRLGLGVHGELTAGQHSWEVLSSATTLRLCCLHFCRGFLFNWAQHCLRRRVGDVCGLLRLSLCLLGLPRCMTRDTPHNKGSQVSYLLCVSLTSQPLHA
jgi:hypothetical protein